MKINLVTKLPGKRSLEVLKILHQLNGAHPNVHPFVHSGKGQGCYFKDLDGNTFLDFASQVASLPLGYNHPDLLEVLKKYSNSTPIKYAGQDFMVKEHADLLEELLNIVPKGFTNAFLLNSGAEAVENCIKIAMRGRPHTQFGICFEGSFHGRTLGALSFTTSKKLYTSNYLHIPRKILSFTHKAPEELEILIKHYGPEAVGFVMFEPIQGEGGYRPFPFQLVKELRKITKQNGIPLIADEVQCGMGRTGTWWALEQYKCNADIMSAAKALQVGACIANKIDFPKEAGAISSTWGGGHVLDMAMGLQIIKTIKKNDLLGHIISMGGYLRKRLLELQDYELIDDVRGFGLMQAFDMADDKERNNMVVECFKNGLVVLGCGHKGIRLIPPYIVTKNEIDEAIGVIDMCLKKVRKKGFKHYGQICNYLYCGENHT